MEDTSLRTLLVTAVAPIAWGTTYIVTENFLPPDRPLFAAAARALPAGLVLLAWRRQLPHGDWWWKAALLGLCNIGLFFPLIFLAAYELPGGLAATVQAMSPLAVMAIALPALGERPGVRRVVAALVGLLGVGLLVLRAGGELSTLGLVAAVGSVVVSALGFVLVKRWPSPTDMLTTISWQLVAGGLVLVPVALIVEGAPPALSATNLGRPAVADDHGHGGRVLLLVPRPGPDARRCGRDRRTRQPGRRHPPRRAVRRRAVRLGPGPGHGARARRRRRRPTAGGPATTSYRSEA